MNMVSQMSQKSYVDPEVIRRKVQRVALDNLWLDLIKAKKPPMTNRRCDTKPRFYAELPKLQAKLMLSYEVGELNLRANRKNEAVKKYGGYQCLVKGCNEPDSFEHIKECFGYSTKLKKGASPYEFIDFLVKLEGERVKNFNKSLVNFRVL